MAIAAADPAPAEVITWARGIDHVAGGPDPEGAGPAGVVDDDEATLVDLAAQTGEQTIGVRHVAGPDEHGVSPNHLATAQLDTGQPVFLDLEPCHLAADDPNPASVQLDAFGRGQVIGVDEEDDVVRPLADEECVLDRAWQGAENADRLVSDLPPVAVRAVQQIPAPPLADPGDLRQLVVDTGRNQDTPAPQHAVHRARRTTNPASISTT